MSSPFDEPGLVKAATIREIVVAFVEGERMVREAFALVRRAEDTVNAAFTLGGVFPMHVRAGRHSRGEHFDDPDGAVFEMRRDAWGAIVERLELRRFLSIKRFDELEKAIREEKEPAPITEENVRAFVRQYTVAFADVIREAVVEVYDFLRPHRLDHKTNSQLEIGPKVILTWTVERDFMGRGFRIRHHSEQRLIALDNVFSSLDGKGSVSKTHYSELHNVLADTRASIGSTTFYHFKCFRNGNLHLKFRRLDLLKRLNEIAGGKTLRPTKHRAVADDEAMVANG